MPYGPGSNYDADLEKILRKHGIGRAMVLVHQANTPVEKYEKLLIGNNVHLEWQITALEGFVGLMDALNKKGELLTAKPPMPEPKPEDVRQFKERGIDVG